MYEFKLLKQITRQFECFELRSEQKKTSFFNNLTAQTQAYGNPGNIMQRIFAPFTICARRDDDDDEAASPGFRLLYVRAYSDHFHTTVSARRYTPVCNYAQILHEKLKKEMWMKKFIVSEVVANFEINFPCTFIQHL